MTLLSITVSIVSLLIAITSVLINWYLWNKINRPIIIVRLTSSGATQTALDILIENTGNLPAKDIRITAKEADILKCYNGSSPPILVRRILLEKLTIPVLANGKRTVNAFHAHSDYEKDRWISGSYLPIEVEYYSLNERKYKENYSIRFAIDNAFAFMKWETSSNKK